MGFKFFFWVTLIFPLALLFLEDEAGGLTFNRSWSFLKHKTVREPPEEEEPNRGGDGGKVVFFFCLLS